MRDAVECHGGIGFTWECDVQLWFKRCMFDRAFLGPPPATASAPPTSPAGKAGTLLPATL